MGGLDEFATALLAFCNKDMEGDDAKTEEALCVVLLKKLKPVKANATKVQRAVLAASRDDEQLVFDTLAYFVGWLSGLEVGSGEAQLSGERRDGWVAVLTPHTKAEGPVPAPADAKATLPAPAVQRETSLRSLGITIELPVYSGELGGCASFWRKMQRSLVELRVAEDLHFTVIRNQLRSDALDAWWSFHDAAEGKSQPTVVELMKLMVQLFDSGQHAHLLFKWRWTRQLKGESVVKFRTRYMKIVLALREYGWRMEDAQLLADIQTRLRNWQVLSTHNPLSLDELVAASAKIGESNAPEHVPSQQQILLLNDVRGVTDSKARLLYVGGTGGAASGSAAGSGRTIACFNCQGPHHVRDCSKPRACHECGDTTHFVKDCPKRAAKRTQKNGQ